MSALTWRNVSSPDFSGSASLYKTASEQLDKATSGLSTGLKDWQGARMSRAEDQIAQQASQYDSPEAYRAALASGQILSGVDQGLIGKKLIEAAASQESAIAAREKQGAQYAMPEIDGLIQQAMLNKDDAAVSSLVQQYGKQLRLTNSPYADPFKVQSLQEGVKNADAKKAAPYLENAISAASAAGFSDNALAIRNNNIESLQRSGSPMFVEGAVDNVLNKDWLNKVIAATSAQTMLGGKLSVLQQAEKTATPNQKIALYKQFPDMNSKDTLLAVANESGNYTNSDQKPIANAASLATTAISGAVSKSKSNYTNANDDPASGANTVVGDGKFKVPSLEGKLIAKLTIGELEPIQKELIDATRGRTDVFKELTPTTGSSALGKYQIVRETMQKVAPKVFGKDWKNVQFSEENQDKMGEYLFRETVKSGMPLSKQWVGLGKKEFGGKYSDPAKAKNLSWEEVKKDLFASESKPEVSYTKADASAANTLVKIAANAQSNQLSAYPDMGYVDEEVTSIKNNDFASGYKYFLKQAAIPDKNFTQRQFMDLYAQYGKVQTPASVAEVLKNPSATPVYEPVPLGAFSLALSRTIKNSPDFGSTTDKPLNGRLLSRLLGALSPNDFFFGSKKLKEELANAASVKPGIVQDSVKQAKLLEAAAENAPAKLDALKQVALNWRMMSDAKKDDAVLKKRADDAELAYQSAINTSVEGAVPKLARTMGR